MPNGKISGGVIIEGHRLEITIPAELEKLYQGRPRIVLSKLEWFGIHPLPISALGPELRGLEKDFEVVAIPKAMLKG